MCQKRSKKYAKQPQHEIDMRVNNNELHLLCSTHCLPETHFIGFFAVH